MRLFLCMLLSGCTAIDHGGAGSGGASGGQAAAEGGDTGGTDGTGGTGNAGGATGAGGTGGRWGDTGAGGTGMAGGASGAGGATGGAAGTFLGTTVQCAAFAVSGDPEADPGATWTYVSSDDGIAYDLKGILLKPAGVGTFPAVLVSHGKGGAAGGYAKSMGQHLRDAGAVVIATDYTHAMVPSGSPMGDVGASIPNLQRAAKARQLLTCLAYVDASRVAAHGHSQGAFITGQLVGLLPGSFLVASHTAGGVSDTGFVNDDVPTTTVAVAMAIDTPYLAHHGDDDDVVPLALDERLDEILDEVGTTHHLETRADFTHQAIALDEDMIAAVIAWYGTHALFP